MLRELAASMLDDYAMAKTKLEKSLIISDVADSVRSQGNFVKKDNRSDKWVVAEDLLCREKISAVFRDALHQRCRNGAGSVAKKALHQACQEKKRRSSAPPVFQTQPTLQWGADVTTPNFGLAFAPTMQANETHHTPVPPLFPQVSVPKNDFFSIFSVALSNVCEDGDPFEPKPIFEASRSA